MITPIAAKILLLGVPLIIAVVIHEVAHGWVASKLGDPTARTLGRITLNPIKHIDPVMTLLLPGMLIFFGSPVVFGGAKPVPINPGYFKNPRRGMVLVAAAGPIVNFLLAALFAGILHLVARGIEGTPTVFQALTLSLLFNSVLINLVLALFNLVPVPPLDGGRIAVGLLPVPLARLLAKLEPYGLLIVFALLYSGKIESYLSSSLELLARAFHLAL